MTSVNIITIYNPKDNVGSFNLSSLSSNAPALKIKSSDNTTCKKDIYVCTFCQVFSPYFMTVVEHISSTHFESLPIGTAPENFVSKLKSLEGISAKKKGSIGRPKKKQEKSVAPPEVKEPIRDPVPDANGLFWCKKCLRNFRKSRQLTQHICLDSEDEDSSDESESSVELKDDVEFKTHMDVDPIPWSRRKRSQKMDVNSLEDSEISNKIPEDSTTDVVCKVIENKVVPNWRNDPSYIPLFDDEKEKSAFEEHLRSIDYSYVDNLFEVEEKRCRNRSKSPCVYVQSIVYTCKYCKKVMKSLSHIRLHCLIHTDIKPFTCPKCSYSSNSKGSLYMHMRKHTGNVFCCSFCEFKCHKRSHLLDHEATHSSVSQICKLCKNSYKTLRSLIAHIRKYHNYAGGRSYIKSLTSKQSKEFKCDMCNKKFKSPVILKNHKHACHEMELDYNKTTEIYDHSDQNSKKNDLQIEISDNVDLSPSAIECNNMQTKDPLAEIVLNNFLQQKQSQAVMYENVFREQEENILSPPSQSLLEEFRTKTSSKSSILEECQKTLNLDIFNECLQNTNFSNECQNFNLLSSQESMQNGNSNATSRTTRFEDISESKSEEPKSVEIKLFEKCQRAPAYVCCVCSSIYIYPSTLKAHLREHVNNTSSSLIDQVEEPFETAKISEASSEIDVCQILQDSSESCSYDKELEKLYTSSLDMMYYLPEVSVVLENDPALFDSVLDDIKNFPMNVNSLSSLNVKEDDVNILKCFAGL